MQFNLPLKNILFLDIETVPQTKYWNDLEPKTQELWDKKTTFLRKREAEQNNQEITPEDYYLDKAGIFAEFGKIICISCGIIIDDKQIKIKSFSNHNESKILLDFNELLNSKYFNGKVIFCAHNGKEFDFPYIARRMIINEIPLPNALQIQGKKPWEILHLDTLELWKFGDYKHFTSLDLLAHILGIPSPKSDIDGSQVSKVYYENNDLPRIKKYCEQDVITLINVFQKLRYQPELFIS